MGIAHASTVLRLTNLSPSSKAILLVMALEADGKGNGSLTTHELALYTGLSTRTIRDHLPQLFATRLIEKRPYDADYLLTLPPIF